MEFNDYQKKSRETAMYPEVGNNIAYPALGLSGEVGEIANAVKKIYRDDIGVLTEERKKLIEDGLGDALWYIAQLATEAGFELEEIAKTNLAKIQDRKQRGVIQGEGHYR